MLKQNPFSLYDFFGYLIPGSILIYILLIFENIKKDPDLDLIDILSISSSYKFQEIFLLIIGSYTLGHILSFVSSITIEKYGNWNYGYPSKYLIGYKKRSFWVRKNEPASSSDKDIYEIEAKDLRRRMRNIGRIILSIFLLPLTVADLIIGKGFNFKKFYQNEMDIFIKESIELKVKNLVNKLGIGNNSNFSFKKTDFHRIVTHYTFENCKEHQFRMVNYVSLYGFLRNLALIFNIASWYYIIFSIDIGSSLDLYKITVAIVLILLSYISFMAYMKFYRRYTLEGLMLLIVDENI